MRVKETVFAGLDIESTSSDTKEGGLIQIGVYMGPYSHFVSDVRPSYPYKVEAEAMEVNGFTEERIKLAPLSEVVDQNLRSFLDLHNVKDRRLIAVGWNVAGFDLPFVRRFLPQSFTRLSYRTVDLNAVCFTIDPFHWEKHKRWAKKYAAEQLAETYPSEAWHDALYDAAAAYHAWMYLHQTIKVDPVRSLLLLHSGTRGPDAEKEQGQQPPAEHP